MILVDGDENKWKQIKGEINPNTTFSFICPKFQQIQKLLDSLAKDRNFAIINLD